MFSIFTRSEFALAVLTIAAIPAGAAFAAEGGHEFGGFSGAESDNHGAGQTVFTSHGPVVTTGGTDGYRTTTLPGGGGQGLLLNNGNGTSTLTGPRGVTTTVPSPE
jgi:hypothetical protein